MAQSKVIDFYPTTKRRTDQQSSKRRKIQDASNLFTTSEQKPETESPTLTEPVKRKTRTSSRKSTRKTSTKSQPNTPSSQKIITDFINHPPEISNSSPLGSSEDFTFKKTSPVPLEHTYIATDFTNNSISPSTTPTKRSHELKPTTRNKRKRRTDGSDTPTCDIEQSLNKDVTKSVRKKLTLPESQTDVNDKTQSKKLTRQSKDQNSNKEIKNKLDNDSKQVVIPDKLCCNDQQAVTTQTKEPSITMEKDTQSNSKTEVKTKKSTAAEMIERLKKCGKLADLKSALKKVDDLTKNIKSKKTSRSEQKTKVSAVVPPVPEQNTEQLSASAKPAYERYKDLAVDVPPSLTLPHKYKLLEAMFKGTDTIVSILHNRLERCTFNKLKQGVQDMIRRTFEPHHLGQINTVYPDCYKISHERGVVETGIKSSSKYTMCIEAQLDVDENSSKISRRKDGRPVFSTNQVMMRKQTFKHRLYEICKQHHQAFLEKLNPPIKVDSDKLTRWHPKFLVDNVPEIEPTALPKPPDTNSKPAQTAQQVLESCRGKVPSRIEQALKKVAEAKQSLEKLNKKNEIKTSDDNIKKDSNTTTDNNKTSTAGISSSLLERIRAKEALKAQAAMLRDEEAENELEMLGRLPDMIKIIRSCYITEKKPALLEDVVIVKVCDSYKSAISQSSVEKHLEYIQKIFPKWMQKVKLSSGTFLKLNRETELSNLYSLISKLVKQKQYI